MKRYQVTLSKTAQKQLDKIPDNVASPILNSIAGLASDPRPQECKKLRGRNGYRIRQGIYRIIDDIVDALLLIEVIALGHRKNIYE